MGVLHAGGAVACWLVEGDDAGIVRAFYGVDKVLCLVLLYEAHLWADCINAVVHETAVILACVYAGALAWWAPRVADMIVLVYAGVVVTKVRAALPCMESRDLWCAVGVGAVSYSLGMAGLVHLACVVSST